MQKQHMITAGFAIGIYCLGLTGSAHAQQVYNTSTSQAEQWTWTPEEPMQAQASAPAAEQSHTQQSTDESNDWNYTVGGGVGYMPTFEGSDNYKVRFVPVVNIDYKEGLFFANGHNGIGSYLVRGENYKMGASVGYAMGRDVDDDKKHLTGLGDVDASATANFLAEYDFGPAQLSGKITTALSGDYGTTAEANLGSRYRLGEKLILSGSVGTLWANDEHMDNRFGINATQSVASGYTQHDAESGIKSVGFSVGATYLLTDSWNANLTFRGDQLLGDAADSPIVKEEFVPMVFLTTSYKF